MMSRAQETDLKARYHFRIMENEIFSEQLIAPIISKVNFLFNFFFKKFKRFSEFQSSNFVAINKENLLLYVAVFYVPQFCSICALISRLSYLITLRTAQIELPPRKIAPEFERRSRFRICQIIKIYNN